MTATRQRVNCNDDEAESELLWQRGREVEMRVRERKRVIESEGER